MINHIYITVDCKVLLYTFYLLVDSYFRRHNCDHIVFFFILVFLRDSAVFSQETNLALLSLICELHVVCLDRDLFSAIFFSF